jgi:gamma-glutamyl-gamma-aminobutyrate hydrolase PuuD
VSNKVLLICRTRERVPPYANAATAAGLDPVIVEAGSPIAVDEVHGLLLMGGIDVDPAQYGEQRDPNTDEPDPELDRAERDAIEAALRQDMPILAICRGMQLLNVHHGGTLVQHLTPVQNHRSIKDDDRSLPIHPVDIQPDSLLSRVMRSDSSEVNSRHHQAVKKLGEGLRVSATAADGIVEAIERGDRTFVLGVQWHPEDQIHRDRTQLKLFQGLRDAMQR